MKKKCAIIFILGLVLLLAGCSSPITLREQGGLIGAGLGAGTGAVIGSTVGHAAAGALIGGPAGLVAGALIGDQLMRQGQTQYEQQRQLDENQAELERLRRENRQLREQQIEK